MSGKMDTATEPLWIKNRLWRELYVADQARLDASGYPAPTLDSAGLPQLLGSEKQVACATKIRATALANAQRLYCTAEAEFATFPADVQVSPKFVRAHDMLARVYQSMHAENRAGWWIDYRDRLDHPAYLAERVNRALRQPASHS